MKQNEAYDTCFSLRRETASALVAEAVDALEKQEIQRPNLIWLELTGCSGNIISLLDGVDPDFKTMALKLVHLVYDNSLMTAEGEAAMEKMFDAAKGNFILAVEGAVATKDDGLYNVIGRYRGEAVTARRAIELLGEKAAFVLAVGTCASDGGISAARPNPGECFGISSLLRRKVIKLPGCPCNPYWFLGTLADILLHGEPELDRNDRPLLFYSTLIHDLCPRRPYFEQKLFASHLGEKGCMFKLGCRGPVTRSECPVIQWNNGVKWPIGDNSPCIGCAMFGFPDRMEPFISYHTTKRGEENEAD
jgi:hydrogenase small subunit